VYGSFQTFATSANLLIKPFGASDIDISIAAVCLILLGTLGAVIGSIIIKKYRCYKLVLRVCCVGSLACIIFFAIQLLTIDSIRLIQVNVGVLGFFLTPIIPVSYEIGCEIAFPIG
jgi:drug/metabolite transporter (DMT)-like permease